MSEGVLLVLDSAGTRTVFTSFLFQAGFASFEFCLEKYGNLILADGILWRLNYFTSVRSRLTSAYNNNNNSDGVSKFVWQHST